MSALAGGGVWPGRLAAFSLAGPAGRARPRSPRARLRAGALPVRGSGGCASCASTDVRVDRAVGASLDSNQRRPGQSVPAREPPASRSPRRYPTWTRTRDSRINNPMLCRLSYGALPWSSLLSRGRWSRSCFSDDVSERGALDGGHPPSAGFVIARPLRLSLVRVRVRGLPSSTLGHADLLNRSAWLGGDCNPRRAAFDFGPTCGSPSSYTDVIRCASISSSCRAP